ncbi:hypothetical protein C0992_011093 [Termitomyces sp. T32_za158]|nr:hypothetical protein C0992_011093 [Termitomyces sp. T32_za158]
MLKTMCGTPSYLAPEVVAQSNNEGLTNSSPFVEEEQQDVRTRILERTIDWSVLMSKEVSAQAIDFVQCLLETDPRQRMTLAYALQHPWLKSHVPVYGPARNYATNIRTSDYLMVSAGPVNEGSFRGSVNDDFQNMHIEHASSAPAIPGTFTHGLVTNGSTPRPTRGAPLQRGSLAVLQAMENGTLSDPPVEMIANAAAQDLREKQANINSKGINKRVHSELTPPKEEPDDVIDGTTPSTAVDNKVSNSNEEPNIKSTPAAGRKGRGRGRPTSASSHNKSSAQLATTGAESEGAAKTPARRSSRLQKVARRT